MGGGLETYHRYREQGLCGKCGAEPLPEHTRCDPCRIKDNENNKHYVERKRNLVFDAYGKECACCGEAEPMFLAIDHVNNNGAEQRAEFGSDHPVRVWNWAIKNNYPDSLQLLCMNCNWGKYINGGVCPHNV